jgi:excisionase family DNA binding protein
MARTETPTPPHLLTPAECANYLGFTLSTVYTMASRRQLPSVKLGKKSLRFRRSDLDALVKAGLRPALMPLNGPTTPEPER